MSDLLLEWMSFRNSGDVDDVPPDFSGGTRPQRIVDDLAMLGHLETFNAASWKIAPPVLAGMPHDSAESATAVLCGARTPGVLARLGDACRHSGAEMMTIAVANRPSVVRLVAACREALTAAAAQAGIALQDDAAFTLLACLPAVSQWPRTPCPMVAGRVDIVRQFSRSELTWIVKTLPEATAASGGLFRIKRDWDSVTILKSSVTDCARIDDRAGRFIVAAKRRQANWDKQTQTLSFPLQLYPPVIIARALILCTGGLPVYRDRRVHFRGVTPAVLKLALAITGLRLT